MPTVSVICSDERINSDLRGICANLAADFQPHFLRTRTRAIQFLNYEMPEINVVYLSDPALNAKVIIEEIRNDPWLHYGGTIIIHKEQNEQTVYSKVKGVNLLAVIHADKIASDLQRVFEVLKQNNAMLLQWNLNSLIRSNLSGRFHITSDAFDLITHVNLLSNFLYNSNLITRVDREKVYVAFMEVLMYASNIKTQYSMNNEGKRNDNLTIELTYRITQSESEFTIKNTVPDFTWETERVRSSLSGMPLLNYSTQGDLLTINLQHLQDKANRIPQMFRDQEETHFTDQQIVFTQGEESDYLYYIVSGRYEIIANSRKVSELSPSDIFLGEMSFLLKNKRSATVRSVGEGKLIRISKEEFIQALKRYPHYGFFLSRLLAQRLVEQHGK
ncbi:MAG: cyclic nucleotide-binding domain-containing protein [Spirochaetia bacterium]